MRNHHDQSRHITSQLVALYDLQKQEAVPDKTTESESFRGELMDAVSALLSMELSVRESELVSDVLICLMQQVQKDLCVALSEKLSRVDNAPLRLMMHLATDTIEVARPVLRHSSVFEDMDLVYIIRAKTADYWREIANRADVTDSVALELVGTEDRETNMRLVLNKHSTFSQDVLSSLGETFSSEPEVISFLLKRREVTDALVADLYQHASTVLRGFIAQEYPDFYAGIGKQLVDSLGTDDMDIDFIDFSESDVPMPSVDQKQEDGPVVRASAFLGYLKKGLYREFIQAFSDYLDVDKAVMKKMLFNEKWLAVLCRTVQMDRYDFSMMNVLVWRMVAGGSMVDTQKIARTRQYFDAIAVDRAQLVLQKIRNGEITL